MTNTPPSPAPAPELPCPKHNGENGSSKNRVGNSECPARGPFPAVPRRTSITQGDQRGRVAVRRLNVGVWNHGNTRSPNVATLMNDSQPANLPPLPMLQEQWCRNDHFHTAGSVPLVRPGRAAAEAMGQAQPPGSSGEGSDGRACPAHLFTPMAGLI